MLQKTGMNFHSGYYNRTQVSNKPKVGFGYNKELNEKIKKRFEEALKDKNIDIEVTDQDLPPLYNVNQQEEKLKKMEQMGIKSGNRSNEANYYRLLAEFLRDKILFAIMSEQSCPEYDYARIEAETYKKEINKKNGIRTGLIVPLLKKVSTVKISQKEWDGSDDIIILTPEDVKRENLRKNKKMIGLSPDTEITIESLKKQKKCLAKIFHDDKMVGMSKEEKKIAQTFFKQTRNIADALLDDLIWSKMFGNFNAERDLLPSLPERLQEKIRKSQKKKSRNNTPPKAPNNDTIGSNKDQKPRKLIESK